MRVIRYLPHALAQRIAFLRFYAAMTPCGALCGLSFASSPKVLGGCCEQEFVSCTARTSQPQTRRPENAFKVSKEHLDLLATMSGLLIFGRGSNRSGDIAGIFVEITRYVASTCIWAAALLQVTGVAIALRRRQSSPCSTTLGVSATQISSPAECSPNMSVGPCLQ